MPEVVVVGGGVVGASAAYHLLRAGASVTLIDASHSGQATAAGAGIISPGTTARMPLVLFPLSAASVAFYPRLLASLREDGEADTGFASVGTLFVATTDEEAAQLPEIRALARRRRAEGVDLIGEVTELSSPEAQALFPPLAPVAAALHIAGASRVDGRLLRDALQRAVERRGGTIVRDVARLVMDGDRVTAVEVGSGAVSADAVILAGGVWSHMLGLEAGQSLPVVPQRGQILHLDVPGVDAGRWPIVLGFHSHYLLTFPFSRVVAGATREDASGYEVRVTAGGAAEVLGEALRIAPGLYVATIQEIRVGLRPATPDGLPMLGKVPHVENLFVATGHGPSGLQLGPFSGAAVADLALGHPAPVDLTPFDPHRFEAQS